jgi:PAS domain S-box-containing protein
MSIDSSKRAMPHVREMASIRTTHSAAAGSEQAPIGHRNECGAESRAQLLVVDDDRGAIQFLRQTLRDIGDVHFADSGESALRLAAAVHPDIVLLDASMPGMDGFEVCAALKRLPEFRHVPVVFVTKLSDSESELRALAHGAADFIAKPYTPVILKARVRNLLELKRRMSEDLSTAAADGERLADSRVRAIVAAASDAIVSIDASRRLALINDAAATMFRIDRSDMLNAPVAALLGDFQDMLLEPTTEPIRVELRRPDGSTWAAEISVSRVDTGNRALTTMVLRDLGARETVERERGARARAEAASEAKSRMLSFIAHEIGNPLNGILGMAHLLACSGEHPLVGEQARYLRHVQDCGNQIRRLMCDLIDVGRVELGQLTVELCETELGSCIDLAMMQSVQFATDRGIELSLRSSGVAIRGMADSSRLHQCLLNLLSNAIKYGRPGGRVEIQIHVDPETNEAGITICDDGIGMDANQIAHLYEPFNRLGRQATNVPGTGLGMLLTRQLVEAMNGRLTVQSAVAAGTTFTIWLKGRTQDSAPHGR